jgi:hypothetical protein
MRPPTVPTSSVSSPTMANAEARSGSASAEVGSITSSQCSPASADTHTVAPAFASTLPRASSGG